MSAALGLDPLLTALREAGLPVGVVEMARLQRVFALEPQLEDDRRLRSILRTVLVKSAEDHAHFEPVFDAWVGRAGQEVTFNEALPPPLPPPNPVTPSPTRKRPLWRAMAAAALPLLVLVLAYVAYKSQTPPKTSVPSSPETLPEPTPKPTPRPTPEPVSVSTGRALTPDEIRKRTFETWIPVLTVKPAKTEWKGWPSLTLGCLALFATGGLWAKARRKNWMPAPASEPPKKGPPRVFLTPPDLAGSELLEPREQEALVWGIGHFVAEETTRRLDLTATVRETAKAGGIPNLRFHQARYPREVWLWIDDGADDPSISRVADEIEAALQTHGLPTERALFRGVPNLLVKASGQTFAPNEVDERRDAALVAILTDGRILARQYAADDRRVRLDALLRSLSHWPRLAFVDFSADPGNLTGILAKHSLLRISPSGLVAFLGSDETVKRKPGGAISGDAVWAAACAVAPASIDELRALQLRKRLRLATSPWALRTLRAEAPGPPGRLQWQPRDRARRVNWLTAAEAQDKDDNVASQSLLGRALDFWEEVYERELKDSSRLETPAHQHLSMERALLSLWRQPGKGARSLHPLHGGALREVIEQQLQNLAPADWGSSELLHLPWAWGDLPAPERVMLQRMKLGGGMPEAQLRRPGRLWAGLGLCLGLAVGALGAAAFSGQSEPEVGPIVHIPERPEGAWEETRPLSAGLLTVAVATRKSQTVKEVSVNDQVTVQWQRRHVRCVTMASNAEEWNCGRVPNPPGLPKSQWRRIVILAARPGSPDADALAVDLLDSGSADRVIITTDWIPYTRVATMGSPLNAEILVLASPDWGMLRKALHFEGIQTVQKVWPNLKLLVGSPSTQLRGVLDCQNGKTFEEGGMIFVRICPGTFMMGSANNDPQAEGDEKPAHSVTLSEFWISSTEVTNAQYRKDHPDNDQPAVLPVVDVSWYAAKNFCERHGWRLPTEAEWEYAARAGSQTPWSFVGDERQLGEYAWFKEDDWYKKNVNLDLHPPATKKPNPWGLYDMHGNAWEWVEDRYGPYSPGAQTDLKGPNRGGGRSLRGGGYSDDSEELRSANRHWLHPGVESWYVGFRCVRRSRPQP